MKILRTIVFVIITTIILVGCSHGDPARGPRVWTAVTPQFDSVSRQLERSYLNPTPLFVRDSLTRSLPDVKTTAGRAQRLYWDARLARITNLPERADSLVSEGLAAIDSAAYPYEWARLISIRASLPTIPVRKAYDLTVDNLRYFTEAGDSLMTGATLMSLGAIMWCINDTAPAARYYMMADSIFTLTGNEHYRVRNLVNIANILDRPETLDRRDSLMSFLLTSPVARADSSYYHTVLRNEYLNTGDPIYLRRAYDFVKDAPQMEAERAAYQGMLADYFISVEQPDSVTKYARMAYNDLDKVTKQYDRMTILNAMAFTAYCNGEYDASLDFYRGFLDARLTFEQERFSLETTKADYRSGFEQMRREEQMRHAREREIWIVALILACALAVAVGVVFYFRVEKARVKRERAEVELMQNRNYLSACALAIDEKDRIIDSLVKSVDKMHSDGKIAGSEARELTANVRRSLNNSLERETFTELHKKLHPEFIRRLKKDFPMLTESQLKHAAYIAMGLSAKQIAQIMNIEYESVKKSRTRLRARMELPPGSSLEDTLRAYAANI